MTEQILSRIPSGGEKILQHLNGELATLVVGRATPALVEGVSVEQYGSPMPLKSVAQITVDDAQSLVVAPWDKQMLGPIEKAIQSANLGFSLVNNGEAVRVILPPPSQERRQQMLKVVSSKVEESKISLRNLRHETMEALKHLDGTSKDEVSRAEDTLEKHIQQISKRLDEAGKKKETEISQI